MMGRPFIAFPILLLCAPGTAVAEPASLLDVFRAAEDHDPAYAAARSRRDAGREAKPQALAGLLPSLDLAASYEEQTQDGSRVGLTDTGGIGLVDVRNETDSENLSLAFRQTLFDWSDWVRLSRADLEVARAEAAFMTARQSLILRVTRSTFAVLAAEARLDEAQATVEAFREQTRQVEDRYEVGMVALTDLKEARAALDEARAGEIDAKRQLALATETLRRVAGREFELVELGEGQLALSPPQPADVGAWVSRALEANPELVQARLTSEIAQEDVRMARAERYPSLDFVARRSVIERSGDNLFDNLDVDEDIVGIEFSVPLFAGGAINSRVREASHLSIAAKDDARFARLEVEQRVRDAFLLVESEKARVEALRQVVVSTEASLDATQDGFDVGTRTAADVLEVRQRLSAVRAQLATSRYAYLTALLELEAAAGDLAVDDLEAVTRLMTSATDSG